MNKLRVRAHTKRMCNHHIVNWVFSIMIQAGISHDFTCKNGPFGVIQLITNRLISTFDWSWIDDLHVGSITNPMMISTLVQSRESEDDLHIGWIMRIRRWVCNDCIWMCMNDLNWIKSIGVIRDLWTLVEEMIECVYICYIDGLYIYIYKSWYKRCDGVLTRRRGSLSK